MPIQITRTHHIGWIYTFFELLHQLHPQLRYSFFHPLSPNLADAMMVRQTSTELYDRITSLTLNMLIHLHKRSWESAQNMPLTAQLPRQLAPTQQIDYIQTQSRNKHMRLSCNSVSRDKTRTAGSLDTCRSCRAISV